MRKKRYAAFEAATGGFLQKQLFFKISQYSQENTYAGSV